MLGVSRWIPSKLSARELENTDIMPDPRLFLSTSDMGWQRESGYENQRTGYLIT